MKNSLDFVEVKDNIVFIEIVNELQKEIPLEDVLSYLKDSYENNDEIFLLEELRNNKYYIMDKFLYI